MTRTPSRRAGRRSPVLSPKGEVSMCKGLMRRVAVAIAGALLVSCASTPKTAASGVRVQGPEVREEGARGAGSSGSTEGQMPEINTRAKLLFEDAVKAFESQRKSRAIDYVSLEKRFQAAADADPALAEADYNLGVLAEAQGKTKEAVEHYRTALRKKPTLKQAAENLGVISQNAGDEDAAIRVYQNILENYPDDASSRARLADIYRRRGDHDQAIELAREALFRDPKTLPAYKVMMGSYLEQQRLSMAKLVALRAMKIDDNDPELYHTLGLVLLAEKEPAKAREQFKRAIAARKDYLPSHVVLAKMALESQNYAGAEESLRRILQADGKNAEALVLLGVAYKGMGQYDRAMQAYDAAEKVNPNLAAIYLNRGIILGTVKDAPERAMELYKQFLKLTGGEVGLSGDHQVFALIREAESKIAQKEEAKRAEEEARRMEEEAKVQQKAADAEVRKQKEAELREQLDTAKGKGAAKGKSSAVASGATKEAAPKAPAAEEADGFEELDQRARPAPKAAPGRGRTEAAAPPPAPTPAPEAKQKSSRGDSDEPEAEPEDDL